MNVNRNQIIHYLLQNLDHLAPINPISDTFTVVIFSSPIDDWCEAQGAEVVNILWPSVTRFHNANGTRLASAIFNTLRLQLQIQKNLRIVCIDALDSNGELSGERAKNVLDYLAKSMENTKSNESAMKKSVIDVIILPNFNPNVAGPDEIMNLLWYLKKHAVLISNSSLHSSLPSIETIAVSGATKFHQTPASVIDFVVTAAKEKRLQSVTSDTVEDIPDKPTILKKDTELIKTREKRSVNFTSDAQAKKNDTLAIEETGLTRTRAQSIISDTSVFNENEDNPETITKDAEWLDLELARAKAPGVTAAVALGVLRCLLKHYSKLLEGIKTKHNLLENH